MKLKEFWIWIVQIRCFDEFKIMEMREKNGITFSVENKTCSTFRGKIREFLIKSILRE